MKISGYICILAASLAAFNASAQSSTDTVPSRAIIVSGNPDHPDHAANIAQMYSRANLAFEDPAAPRFLFLDKKGTVAIGIGGYLKAVAEYDVDGAVANNDFYTNMIPVPFDPAQRQRFGATAAHSTIFLKLVTRPTRVGRVIVYIQTNFTGDNGGYGLKLKQAYVSVGHVTLGKARSTFADGPAMAPTIDDQGPSGQVTAKNMMVQYATSVYSGFSAAISAELPSAGYTTGTYARSIAQRVPDFPAYVQYQWDKGDSHIRLSGILRELSYRDNVAEKNRFATGWGVQLSAVSNIVGGLQFFGHYTYGKGIGYYINDLSDMDYDLIPDPAREGRLKAPGAAGWTAGLRYNFSDNFFISSSYSRAQLYNTRSLAGSPETYRYGQYIVANAFYNLWDDLRIGAEYIHGTRKNIGDESGHANRLMAMLQYSF